MSRRSTVLLLLAVVLLGGLWLRHYFSPGRVVTRKLLAAVAAFEEERLLAVMASVSRSYSDSWGGDYEMVAGSLNDLMTSYDDLDVDLVLGEPGTVDGRVSLPFEFFVSGRDGGERELLLGSRADPCLALLLWQREEPGWRLVSTLDLDIPELRDELASRRARTAEHRFPPTEAP